MLSSLSSLGVAVRALGIAVAMLALAARFVSGTVVVDVQALDDVARVLAASVPCESGTGAPSSDKAPHRGLDAGLIAMAALLGDAGPTLVPTPPALAEPSGIVLRPAPVPPARAPPLLLSGAALPRGPPVLI